MNKKVAILGGGNGAYAAAADLTMKGIDVNLCPRKAPYREDLFKNKTLTITGAIGEEEVKIHKVTSDIEEAISDVKVIFVIVPAVAHKFYAEELAPIIKEGQIVCLLPGTFGSLMFWNEFKKAGNEKGVSVAETNTLPYATRLIGENDILVMSRFHQIKVGVIPANNTDETVKELSNYYDGLEGVESSIACGLSSLNPVIHVPGCILNAGRIERAKGDFWFYTEGFGPVVVRATMAVDEERQSLLKEFGYEYDIVARGIGGDVQSDDLGEVIAGNENFAKIQGPADVQNRYFSEDIPYGIANWAKLSKLIGIKTPMMDACVNLGSPILEYDCWEKGPGVKDWGIEGMNLEEIKKYLIEG